MTEPNEEGFKESIAILKPNHDADVLKLPHWYLEITNTFVYTKEKGSKDVHFYFKTGGNLRELMDKAEEMDQDFKEIQAKGKF